MKKIKVLLLAAFIFNPLYLYAQEKSVESLVNGMFLELGDSRAPQNLEVRLQSLGGTCNVDISVAGVKQNFVAPPYIWSPWYKIDRAVRGGTVKIDVVPACDSSVIGKVRYDKQQ